MTRLSRFLALWLPHIIMGSLMLKLDDTRGPVFWHQNNFAVESYRHPLGVTDRPLSHHFCQRKACRMPRTGGPPKLVGRQSFLPEQRSQYTYLSKCTFIFIVIDLLISLLGMFHKKGWGQKNRLKPRGTRTVSSDRNRQIVAVALKCIKYTRIRPPLVLKNTWKTMIFGGVLLLGRTNSSGGGNLPNIEKTSTGVRGPTIPPGHGKSAPLSTNLQIWGGNLEHNNNTVRDSPELWELLFDDTTPGRSGSPSHSRTSHCKDYPPFFPKDGANNTNARKTPKRLGFNQKEKRRFYTTVWQRTLSRKK